MGYQSLGMLKTNVERRLARKVSEDFKKVCEQLIKDFYSSYTPSSYNRIENYKNNVNFSPIKGNRIGGVRVTNNMSNYHKYNNKETGESKDVNGDFVFDLIWNQGIRGLPAAGPSGWVNPYFMTTYYYNSEFGIEGKSPDNVMNQLLDKWVEKREVFIDMTMKDEIEKFDLIGLLLKGGGR